MRKTVSGIVLILLLTSMLTLAFNIQPVKGWTGTVYIRADGSIDPPGAPLIMVGSVAYVLTDSINSSGDGIIVERDNIVIDGAGYTLQGTAADLSKGMSLSGRSNVTIKNITIKSFYYGISLSSSSHNTIFGNSITNNQDGIFVVYYSNNNISGNNITNNKVGVYLLYSSGNIVSGNFFVNDGLFVVFSYQNVVVDNLVNGKPLVYLENVSDMVVEDAGQVTLVDCNRVAVRNLTLSNTDAGLMLWRTNNTAITGNNITANNDYGIYLYSSSNNTISGNKITDNYLGIGLQYSSNYNAISGNTIEANSYHGVWLYWSCNYNTVSGNKITDSDTGVELYGLNGHCDNNIISENNIKNNDFGIDLFNSSKNNIVGNNITANNVEGIRLGSSSNNNISKNNITNSEWQGILLSGSSNNSISGNNITNSWCGMWLDSSSNNMLRNNSMANNTYNFGVLGSPPVSVNDVDASNTVDGKPIYYWVNKRDMAVPLDAGYVALINCTNITVKNLDLKNNIQDLLLAYTINSVITHNNMTNSWYTLRIGVAGIDFYGSSGNSISGNNITNNDVGIFLRYSSNNNSISENNIAANHDHGIWLDYSSNNNSISRNNITNNGGGIYLYESLGNSISGNNITNNLWGILLQHSSNNNIYHNNFINNTYQVASEDSVNVCDDDYPSGGNYWSDYTDVDLYYGPYQNQTGSDGIWDHPYIIDQNNKDRYPLVNPWTPISSYVQGIDVSHYQGDINWSMVYGAGYRFAFVKATGGVSFTDPNFTANMEQASEAGLIVGAYHFAYPEYNDAQSEARHFISVAGNYMKAGYLRPVLDLEDDPNEDSYPYRMGKENLTNWIHTWMNTVKNETGIEPIIYTGWYARVGDYLEDSIAEYDLWIADWTYDPAISPDTGIWSSWDFWQYSNNGSVLGIAGDVDLDLFNGYMQKLYDVFTISNIRMFNVVWENKTYPITVFSNSTVTHSVFEQSEAQISFNITGSHGSKGYCNITIPKDLLKGPWTITFEGEVLDVEIQETENATHSFKYFTFTHASTFRITIQGAWVVPEFPSTIILPLFMLTTLIVTVLFKKKRKTKPQLP